MDSLVVVGTLTVGAVATFTVELLKKLSWFPQNPVAYRVTTAVLCLLLNAGATIATGGTLDVMTLTEAFLSYLTATAAYVHVKK